MSYAKEPRSLRFEAAINSVENNRGRNPGRKISMAAGLRAALFSVSYAALGIVASTETWAQNDDSRNKGRARRSFRRFRSPLPKHRRRANTAPAPARRPRRTAAPLASRATP